MEAGRIAKGQMVKAFALSPKDYGYFIGDDGELLRNFDH